MLIGSHVSLKAPKMLLGSAQEAASYGANTLWFIPELHKIPSANHSMK